MPTLTYVVLLLLYFLHIRSVVLSIRKKDWIGLLSFFLVSLFFISFVIRILFGGSALHDAEKGYAQYQAGHHYLMSHGNWTEISHEKYLFVLIAEIVGLAAWGLSFLLNIILNAREKKPIPFLPGFKDE